MSFAGDEESSTALMPPVDLDELLVKVRTGETAIPPPPGRHEPSAAQVSRLSAPLGVPANAQAPQPASPGAPRPRRRIPPPPPPTTTEAITAEELEAFRVHFLSVDADDSADEVRSEGAQPRVALPPMPPAASQRLAPIAEPATKPATTAATTAEPAATPLPRRVAVPPGQPTLAGASMVSLAPARGLAALRRRVPFRLDKRLLWLGVAACLIVALALSHGDALWGSEPPESPSAQPVVTPTEDRAASADGDPETLVEDLSGATEASAP